MTRIMKLCLAASAVTLIAACEHGAAPADEAVVQPMMEAVVADAAPIGSANVAIGLTDNVLAFDSEGQGFCVTGGGCQSGIVMGSGDIDLSTFPAGDVTITIKFNDDAWNAGYRFPSDAYQAAAIAIDPPGAPTAPTPIFGQANWPSEFEAPSVSSDLRTLTFIDKEDEEAAYEYSVGVNGPGGRVVLDPKIKNGGGTGNR